MPAVRLIGPGRAGQALARALGAVDGWDVAGLLGRADDPTGAAGGVDLLVLAVPYPALVRGTVDNVAALGPAAALTGPVARGDWATVDRHRAALDPRELAAYDAMAELAARLSHETEETAPCG